MGYPSTGTSTHTHALTNNANEKKEKNTMRKHIIAATLTITLAATLNAAAPVRPSDPGMSPGQRDTPPIVRIIKAVKKMFGIGANNLPATPIP
jgi:hypothetical protein